MVEPATKKQQTQPIHTAPFRQKFHVPVPSTVTAVTFSPDGCNVAVACADGVIRVYTNSGKLLTQLVGHTRGANDIAFSPIDSNILALCSDDLAIRLWQVDTGKCIKMLKKHTYHVTTIKFVSKGNILISGSADETVTVWDLTTGKSLKTLAAHSDPVTSVTLTPDDTIIVSASYDGLMRLFDLQLGQCLKTLVYNSASHGTATASTSDAVNFPISSVQISPNGKYILSSSLDGKIRLWDYMANKVVKTYLGPDNKAVSEKYTCAAKFITDGDLLVVSGSDSSGLLFWDVQNKSIVATIPSESAVLAVDVFDGGKLLASGGLDGLTVYEKEK